jgi:hypothetical protein
MNEKEQICYPYAYGRLNSGLDMLANNLQRECMKKDIEIDDKVVDMLQGIIKDLQEKAVVESYEYV